MLGGFLSVVELILAKSSVADLLMHDEGENDQKGATPLDILSLSSKHGKGQIVSALLKSTHGRNLIFASHKSASRIQGSSEDALVPVSAALILVRSHG
jgi:hypothetical protein